MKKDLILAMMAAAACSAYGTVLTADQALNRAMQGNSQMRIRSVAQYQLAQTIQTGDEPGCYVFNKSGDNGYIVLSADDLAPAVLGYSDHGTFDGDNMPPALRCWLDTYAEQIEAARATGATIESSLANAEDFAPIAPMLTTKWGQESPYNMKCPFDKDGQCVTGCLPTAMGQVLNYHKYPKRGIGTHSYEWNGQTLSFDYGNTVFDWDNMLDMYTGSETAEQKNAVATLLYACGVGVNAIYGESTGAYEKDAPGFLVYNLGYDKGVHLMKRDYYTLSDWQKIVYDEISTNGPALYSGAGSYGGHAFVCDGYSGDGYYHFNWGWDGKSDNYFLLTELNPPMQGVGGGSYNFNGGNSILVGMCEPKEGSKPVEMLYYSEAFSLVPETVELGNVVVVKGSVSNYTIVPLLLTMGLKLEAANGDVVYAESVKQYGIESLNSIDSYVVTIPSTLADGTYRVTPVFKSDDGEWTACKVPIACAQYFTAEVSEGVVHFEKAKYPKIEASNVKIPDFYVDKKFEIKFTLTNPTDIENYGGMIAILQNAPDSYVAKSDIFYYNLMPGESVDTAFVSKFIALDNKPFKESGQYTLFLVDINNWNNLTQSVEITLQPESEAPGIYVEKLGIAGGGSVVKNKSNVEFQATFSCEKGRFDEDLYLVIYDLTASKSVKSLQVKNVVVYGGKEASKTIGCDLSACVEGVEYVAMFFYQNLKIVDGEMFRFTIGDASGIESVEADGDANAPLYNLQGIPVDKPAPGVYIRGGKKVLISE